MKKTQKILGLPIISISDGMEVGKVKSIIINAEKGAIDYIVVDSGIQIFSARVIPNEDVLGIGEYALTIENEGVITDISRIPAAIQLLQKDIQVKGTKVLTKKGRLIGEIGDIYIDESDNCKITGLEFIADITQKKVRLIPSDSVITFGKNLTVVKEDVESTLLDTPLQLGSEDKFFEYEKKNSTNIEENNIVTNADNLITNIGESLYKEISVEPIVESKEPEIIQAVSPVEEADNSAAILFEQRQRQYLKGRRATKTISDSSGSVIISEGMVIDDQVIDEAKLKGKLIELVMNNRA
jgi:Uncharacterized protein conserved in bacteria